MWWRILVRSFSNRKARLAWATLSVVLGTSLVASLTDLSLDIPQKTGAQLRAYGANILIFPEPLPGSSQSYILEKDLSYLDQGEVSQSITSYVPYLYSLVEVAGQRVVLAGIRLDKAQQASPWWQVNGRWPRIPSDKPETLVGAQVAEKLKLELGEEFTISTRGSSQNFRVAGIVNTGAAEENQVFVDLKTAQELTNLVGKVSLVQVNALSQKHSLSHLARFTGEGIPGTEVRVVGQIARAERQILSKVQLLMALVSALVLLASGLVILSTMTATFLERTPEIGLMKALGAPDQRIAGLLGAEIVFIAVSGGALGYLLGNILAQIISQRVFATAVSTHPLTLLVTLLTAAIVTFSASVLPLRRAMKVDPAIILRGE